MRATDLAIVLAWRNSPRVRCWQFNSQLVSDPEHAEWFVAMSKDSAVSLLIFEINGQPLGFVQFSRTRSAGVAYWSFYTSGDAQKGVGRVMCRCALNYAFKILHLHKVCGQVLAGNTPSLKLHTNLGFRLEGVLREQHFSDSDYQDVYNFGLLSSEWTNV